jgi:hypothetical protein
VAELPAYDEETGARIIWRDMERPHYTQKKIGDEMVADWERKALPDDARVILVTLIPYRGERAVLAWRDNRLWLPEGAPEPGEDAEAAIRRVALEQAGIEALTATHLGHFRCVATRHSQQYEADSVVYQALYGVDVTSLADNPSDSAYGRSIVLQRDLNNLLRTSYAYVFREYRDALDPWLLERVKANLRQS